METARRQGTPTVQQNDERAQTGLASLDKIIEGGLARGDTILAARPITLRPLVPPNGPGYSVRLTVTGIDSGAATCSVRKYSLPEYLRPDRCRYPCGYPTRGGRSWRRSS